MDLLRITVAIDGLRLTGWELSAMLQEEHAVIPELASFKVSPTFRLCTHMPLMCSID